MQCGARSGYVVLEAATCSMVLGVAMWCWRWLHAAWC